MHRKWLICAWLAMLLTASTVAAQQPPVGGAPDMAPSYGAPITLAQAKRMAAAVEAAAAKDQDDSYVLAIVQPNGELVYFEKADDSTYISIEWAQAKARMAALYRSPSGNLPPGGGTLPAAMPLPGGLPIVYQGKTIGAIGISGAERGGDVGLAQTGIAALRH